MIEKPSYNGITIKLRNANSNLREEVFISLPNLYHLGGINFADKEKNILKKDHITLSTKKLKLL